ncbi:MAG: hypothetical protein FIA99_02025 [Ruminiclostridium sp.]|nr:hypothetical protein [Ruminiclostridium sp.]
MYYYGSRLLYTDNEIDFFNSLYRDIAKAFNIDLSSYNKIDTVVNEKINLAGIHKQLSLKYGDLYSIYLNSSNSAGIVLKQDLEGVYTLYRFETNEESKIRFNINSIDKVQGKYRFINDYFIKNPNPPIIDYKVEGSTLQIIIKDNNQ